MRMVVVTLRPLFRDIVAALLQDGAPVTIVAEFPKRPPVARLALLSPDILVVGLRNGERNRVGGSYAAKLPSTIVLAISSDGRDAYVHKMRARPIILRGVSADTLADALADSKREN
jgi:DNA-binding NarL/FixJ family response regulator